MSVYLGNNLLAGTPDITGKANTSLNNLDSTGQAVIDGKVDLNLNNMNPSATSKETIVGWGMPDYSAQIALSTGTAEQTYTAPSKGYIGYSFLISGNVTGYIKVNEIQVISNSPAGGNYYDFVSGLIPVDKNDVIKYYSNQASGKFNNFQFYPVKGV